jgi:hypothetical protein
VTGTANLHFYGQQSLPLRDRDFPNYDYTLAACEAQSIETKYYALNSFGEPRAWAWLSSIDHSRANWEDRDARATTAHWAAQQAWQYFANTHQWDGPDNQGGELRVLSDWQPPVGAPENTAWYQADGKHHYLYLGRQGEWPMATVDLVGHEYAHAVIQAAADLGYERETGALHEALADILGTMVEADVLGDHQDWVIAQEVGGLRSLARPQDYAQPSSYLNDPLWSPAEAESCPTPSSAPAPSGNDNCGIHTNSGVVNHWFYLLAQGGEQAGVNVSGIGRSEAGQLVFYMIRRYLDPTSDFADARIASIQAATDLFGACSNQLAQVRNAWGAVGVGRPNEVLCVQINGPAQICTDRPEDEQVFEAKAADGASFVWSPLPQGVSYYVTGNQQQYLVIQSLADSLSSVTLSVKASLDSQEANQSLALQAAYCKNLSSRTGQPLPLDTEIWTLYPNPTPGDLEVFIQGGYFPAKISVCDLLGRTLITRPANSANFVLDLHGLTSGCYYVRLDGPAGRYSRMIQVQP